jgi:futalosine hydrolase
LVISAGIGGGFAEKAEIGSLVVASEIVAADLGAQTPEGYLSVDELGFGSSRVSVDTCLAGRLTEALRQAGLPVHTGPILTVSTVTGTAATAVDVATRVPGAAAEAMEGYGVATAAQDFGVRILEIRAISNVVGPRDRDAWRIGDALKALEAASSILPEVLR